MYFNWSKFQTQQFLLRKSTSLYSAENVLYSRPIQTESRHTRGWVSAVKVVAVLA